MRTAERRAARRRGVFQSGQPGPGPRGFSLFGLILSKPITVPPAVLAAGEAEPDLPKDDQLDSGQAAHGVVSLDGTVTFECQHSPWVSERRKSALVLAGARCRKCGGLIRAVLPLAAATDAPVLSSGLPQGPILDLRLPSEKEPAAPAGLTGPTAPIEVEDTE